ncbi:MAG: PilN domain-containing protein [Vicinamibacterales bacterium]
MIKINLLTADKPRAASKSRLPQFDLKGQQLAIGCGLILLCTAGALGWRFYSLRRDSDRVDAAIAEAQKETGRLHSIIGEVQKFEQRRTQLQQRVGLIEQLRRDQKGPVHMLDQISLALPPLMWLTDLKQSANSPDVVIEGRCTGLTGLSDFVANLEASGYFRKSVEIVSTQVEGSSKAGEFIRFVLKAQFQTPSAAPAVPASAADTSRPAPPAKSAT